MKSPSTHLPSLFGSLLFILGAMLFLSVALLMGVTALGTFFTGADVGAQQTIILAVSGFEGSILLVAAYISIQKFLHKPFAEQDSSFSISAWQIVVSLITAGIVVFIGREISTNMKINWLLLPVLTLPAVILPLFVLLGLGIRKIPLGTRWQSWNVFGIGMTIVPFILIFLEALALIFVVIIIIVFLMSQPSLTVEMERLSRQIYMLGPESEAALDLLLPLITKPAVIAIALAYFAVLVPLLEELFKPLGVWLFANQLTSPAQGYALGALSGSAYALIETLGVSAQTTDWANLLLSRIGTGMLHITTSALMGAAILYAVREHRYLRLLGTYLLSISLHGLWNALAIFYSFSNISEYLEQKSPLNDIHLPVTIGMSALAGGLLIILFLSNRKMRAEITQNINEEQMAHLDLP